MKLEEYLKVDSKVNDYGGCYQTAIKDYLVANASPALTEKILNSKKNLGDCFNFILEEIKKEYIEKIGKTNGGYHVSDERVYGLAIHYFEEDSIKPNQASNTTATKTKAKSKAKDYEEELEDEEDLEVIENKKALAEEKKAKQENNKPKGRKKKEKEEVNIPNLFDSLFED